MTLEILTEKSATSPKKGDIVLIHGACMGAWCWMDNFLPWFAAAGYDTHAVSLQNHGNSEKKGSLRMKSIKAYVEDLRQVVDKLQEPVHLIGHSMGGLIIQHYLAAPSPKVKKAVLLCSALPHPDISLLPRLMRDFPWSFVKANLRMSWTPVFQSPSNARKLMLSQQFPEVRIKPLLEKMQDESFVVFLQIMGLTPPDTRKVKTPLFIIGGEKDYLISESGTRKMAAAYGTEPWIVKNAPHNLMMEEGWERIAERISDFLRH
jgi:pimeloyl-ACP methyl ester carboxylesterase